jgi:hypothetical protein
VNLKVVRAVRDIGVNRGATGPHVMECDDGLTYLVKFSGGSKAAVNEFVGQTLARAISLPTPNSALVDLSEDVIGHSGDLRNRAIQPGLHQGSEVVANASDLSELEMRHRRLDEELVNVEVLPGTVCLDNWILTEDRDRAENHLIQAVPGGFRYYMVDFTHSFTGPKWTADSLDQGSFVRVLVPSVPQVTASISGPHSFESTLKRIEALGDWRIEETVAAIPGAWGVSEEERTVLVRFLELRRGLLRSVLTSNAGRFPNWVG